MKAKQSRRLPVETLSPNEAKALVKQCSNRAPTGVRNRALLVTLWRCGLRVAEALALAPKDIDRQKGTIRVLHGKGDKSRTVGIDPQALAVIERWLDRRAEEGIRRTALVFCTLEGTPLAPVYVRNLMKRLGSKAGIEKRVHPHGLRHTHAAELRQEGVDIGVISKQLGHSSIATTARYLDHIAPQVVVDAMQKRTW
jgi:site-specific recombinase XerD